MLGYLEGQIQSRQESWETLTKLVGHILKPMSDEEKPLLTCWPIILVLTIQTTTTKSNKKAYSTRVAPFSFELLASTEIGGLAEEEYFFSWSDIVVKLFYG
jgi:hypothetical protein